MKITFTDARQLQDTWDTQEFEFGMIARNKRYIFRLTFYQPKEVFNGSLVSSGSFVSYRLLSASGDHLFSASYVESDAGKDKHIESFLSLYFNEAITTSIVTLS